MNKGTVLFLLMGFCSILAKAQVPTWSVTPSNFTYSMNVTTKLSVDCIDLQNPSNLIGAFVGTDCRGVDYTSNIVNGNYLAFLTVYSNSTSGETVTFKIYDASLDSVYDAATTVVFQDGSAYGFPTSPFEINTNNRPTDIIISSSTAIENDTNVVVGEFSSVDVDVSDVFTYSLVPGTGDTDNGNFSIIGDSLVTLGVLDYEAKSSYSIRVETNDGSCTYEKQFSISVTDANDAPSGIILDETSINENQVVGTTVGTFTTTDQDVSDTHSYSLVSGPGDSDNSSFTIVGDLLETTAVFNFEVQDTFFIRVESTDAQGLSVQKAIVITVNDLNDAPTDVLVSTNTFMENLVLGTPILTFSASDEDTLDMHYFSFDNSQSSDNASFSIVGNDLRTNAMFDFEANSYYTIRVTAFDLSGANFTKQIILNVTDSNDAPTGLNLSDTLVLENSLVGTFVGTLSPVDQDAVDSYTYSFATGTGDTDNASFTISNDSVFTNTLFNYNTQNKYYIRMKTEDSGGLSFEEQFVITVDDGNDIPTDITIDIDNIDENNEKLTIVGSFYTTDEDVTDSHVYSLVSGTGDTDNNSFLVSNDDLKIKYVADFETQDSYSIRVKTDDGNGGTYEKQITIYVNDVNEAPVIHDTIFYVSENALVNDVIGQVFYTDVDNNDTHTLRILDNSNFVNSDNLIELNTSLNYEDVSSYSFNIQVIDNQGLSDTAFVEVYVNDEIELDLPLPVNQILSPNGDNKNDLFWIDNVQIYSNYSLKIFNNSGFVIFEASSNYDNSWDGTYNGKLVQQGVYYYLFQNNDDPSMFYKGSISIIR